MKFDLENIVEDNFTDSFIDNLIKEYNLCVDKMEIYGQKIELWCYDSDLEQLFDDFGIEVGKKSDVKKEFKFDDDYNPVGLDYGDYIETVELHQNGNTYLVPAYCAHNGCGADYAFSIFETEKTEIYAITVREILEKTVCVRAKDLDDAIDKVESAYYNVEIILEPDDFSDREFVPSEYHGVHGIVDDEEDLECYQKINF